MIRPLTLDELPLCEPFACAFHEELALPGVFSMASFLQNWTFFLTTPGYESVIFGLFADKQLIGGLGALMAPDLNTGDLEANEFFWFVAKEYRQGAGALRLVKAFEDWGDAHDARGFRMVHLLSGLNAERFPKIYEHMKYRPIEVAHRKPNPRFEGVT